jgi:hypothetical protein
MACSAFAAGPPRAVVSSPINSQGQHRHYSKNKRLARCAQAQMPAPLATAIPALCSCARRCHLLGAPFLASPEASPKILQMIERMSTDPLPDWIGPLSPVSGTYSKGSSSPSNRIGQL